MFGPSFCTTNTVRSGRRLRHAFALLDGAYCDAKDRRRFKDGGIEPSCGKILYFRDERAARQDTWRHWRRNRLRTMLSSRPVQLGGLWRYPDQMLRWVKVMGAGIGVLAAPGRGGKLRFVPGMRRNDRRDPILAHCHRTYGRPLGQAIAQRLGNAFWRDDLQRPSRAIADLRGVVREVLKGPEWDRLLVGE